MNTIIWAFYRPNCKLKSARLYVLFSAIIGVLLVGEGWLHGSVHAQGARHERSSTWTPVLRELRAAADGARDYAENNYGVGILLHVGRDILSRSDPQAMIDKVSDFYIGKFAEYGVPARVFVSRDPDGRASGATYHIDRLIHGGNNGTEVKDLQTALDVIPDVVEQLRIAKEVRRTAGQ